jgi:hypothetical protein
MRHASSRISRPFQRAVATTSLPTTQLICLALVILVVVLETCPVESFVALNPRQTTSTSSIQVVLFARPARNQQKIRQQQTIKEERLSSLEAEGDLPANLKRKVEAKRPPLGHVVPEVTRVQGCTFDCEAEFVSNEFAFRWLIFHFRRARFSSLISI